MVGRRLWVSSSSHLNNSESSPLEQPINARYVSLLRVDSLLFMELDRHGDHVAFPVRRAEGHLPPVINGDGRTKIWGELTYRFRPYGSAALGPKFLRLSSRRKRLTSTHFRRSAFRGLAASRLPGQSTSLAAEETASRK